MEIWEGYAQKGLAVKEPDVVYFDARQSPFQLYGTDASQEPFSRIPTQASRAASGGVYSHGLAAAGIRLRFSTDSPYVAIRVAHAPYNGGAPHISKLAMAGFDLYLDRHGEETYGGSFLPPLDTDTGYEGIRRLPDDGLKHLTLYFPCGKQIQSLWIGLKSGSCLSGGLPYRLDKPVVFYGSSITQGIAASRPGNTYVNMIARKLNINCVNLGFSGSALGEAALAEYISGLDMAAFVMDYDHNAPDTAYLRQTHEAFFEIIRQKNRELPIILITKPEARYTENDQQRRTVILETFLNARKRGDRQVYFIDGDSLFPQAARDNCTADGTHPNDLGFHFMSERIGGVLKALLLDSPKMLAR